MYAEAGLMYPYFHNFSQEVQQFEELGCSSKPNASSSYCLETVEVVFGGYSDTENGTPSGIVQTSDVSDYNLWGEGDLFNAPQPVIEEPVMGLDPMTVAISMISCGEDGISPQSLSVSDIESSIESGQLLSEVFYECRKDIMAKEGNETPLSEVLSINIPTVKTDEAMITDEKLHADTSFQKSVSSSSLRSADNMHEAPLRPSFLDFPAVNFDAVYGMRRAFSEGDIKTLGNGNISHAQSPMGLPRIMSSCTSDGRREKLSRYWSKKSKRNFGRKIKYACRKALADSQPRIRGRFAKTEEAEGGKKE